MPTVSRGIYRWLWQGGAILEDAADRLNHVWTFGLMLVLAVIISWKHGYSEPIQCWCPAHFTRSMEDSTLLKAWQANKILYPEDVRKANLSFPAPDTFPLLNEEIPDNEYGPLYKTTFYQWIPLVLCLQALLFKLPNFLMYILHSYSGISFDKLAGLTSGFQNLNMNDRATLSRQVARYIRVWSSTSPLAGHLPWRFLTLLWLIVKILYVVNVVTQMIMLDRFLSNAKLDNATSYSELIYNNLKDNASYWRQSPSFPRRVFFEFQIYFLRNVQVYRIQCIIPGNIFSEHAYIFLWAWLVFVTTVTFASILVWSLKTIVPIFRHRYILKYLEMANDRNVSMSSCTIGRFVNSFLGEDGIMVLKLIEANSSDLLVMEVVTNMWYMAEEQVGSSPTYRQLPDPSPPQASVSRPIDTGDTSAFPMDEMKK